MPAPHKRNLKPSERPQTDEIWGLLVVRLRAWAGEDPRALVRPYAALIPDLTHGWLLASQMFLAPPTLEEVEDVLAQAIQKPGALAGKPRRPAEIAFADQALAAALAPALARVGVAGRMGASAELANLDELVRELETHLNDGQPLIPGLLATPGVTVEQVGALFAAAAEFYRAAPWNALTNAQALAVRLPPESEAARIVCVLGNGGLEYGLAVYESWSDFEAAFYGLDDPRQRVAARGNLALWFGSQAVLPFDDLDALDAQAWPVAGPQSYPIPLILQPERVLRPGPEDLRWLEAVLWAAARAAREHLRSNGQGDYAPFDLTLTAPTQAGPLALRLTYPGGQLDFGRRPVGQAEWEEAETDERPVFDRRLTEKMLAEIAADLDGASGPADPLLRQAQALMYQAWDERNPAKRLALAHQAAAVSPNCADAYVLLAEEEADTAARALEWYQQGVAAGERGLGAEFFAENAGNFWGLLETRPYMRARQGLANTLWLLGRRAEAAGHLRELLRLNPDDNQGARYSLLNLSLEMEDYAAAWALLGQYDDGLAEWLYTRALLLFRRDGSGPLAEKAARQALKENPHTPAYLTGRKRLPPRLPDDMIVGDESEAVCYAGAYLSYWRRAPGAVDWLAGLAVQPRRKSSGRRRG